METRTVSEIIMNLVIRNMEDGSSYEKAKSQAFERMSKDYPEILDAWLNEQVK